MTEEQKKSCKKVIHTASAAAAGAGAGLAQFIGSDNLVITPIQLAMVVKLGSVFGRSITESTAKAAIASASAALVGRTASQVLAGWIPIAGNIINAGTAAGLTEAVGWLIAKEFDEGNL